MHFLDALHLKVFFAVASSRCVYCRDIGFQRCLFGFGISANCHQFGDLFCEMDPFAPVSHNRMWTFG
jgi:hypothetical protein